MNIDQPCLFPSFRQNKARLFYSVCLLSVVIAVLPLWLLPIEFWEGNKIDFAMVTGHFSGEQARLLESRWPLEYFLLLGIRSISHVLSIPYRVFFHLFATIAITGIAIETALYACRAFRLPHTYALLAGFMALMFPAWTSLADSDYLMRALCVWLVLLGYRLVCSHRLSEQFAGVACLLLSFQYQSDFFFIGGLAITDSMQQSLNIAGLSRRALTRTIGLIIIPIILFGYSAYYLKPYGLYAAPEHPPLTLNSMDPLAYYKYVRDFALWPLAAAGACMIGYGVTILINIIRFKAKTTTYPDIQSLEQDLFKGCMRKESALWPIVILCVFAALPSILARESPRFWQFSSGDKHAYLLSVPVSIGTALLCLYFMNTLRALPYYFRFLGLIPLTCCLGFSLSLYKGYSQKAERASFELAVIQSMKDAPEAEPTPGVVSLYYPGLNDLRIEPYEANWLMWRAYKKFAWLAQVQSKVREQGIETPRSMYNVVMGDDNDHKVDEFLPREVNLHCQSIIALEGKRYNTWMTWKWLLGLEPLPAFTSTLSDMKCG